MNDILSTPCPMKHIKKYLQWDLDEELDLVKSTVSSAVSSPTTSIVSMPMTTGTIENASTGGINMVISLVISTPIVLMQSTHIIQTRSTDTKKRLCFEDEVNDDLVTTGTERDYSARWCSFGRRHAGHNTDWSIEFWWRIQYVMC